MTWWLLRAAAACGCWISAPAAAAGLISAAAFLVGCIDIEPPAYRQGQERVVPSCLRDGECRRGRCDASLRLCVAAMPDFPGLLLDVVPETVDQGFGGFHISAELQELATDSVHPQRLELQQPPAVGGLVGRNCHEIPRLLITFVPRETRLGLAVGRYTTLSDRDFQDGQVDAVHKYSFTGLPHGNYDVYWEDARRVPLADPECEVVPQLFRNVSIPAVTDLVQMDLLQADVLKHLEVRIPYTDQLVGWTVDVVHSVTGEIMSTRRVIDATTVREVATSETHAQEFALALKLADVEGIDYVPASDAQLLRLTPPTGALRPIIYFSLFGLVVVDPDVAQLAPLGRFSAPVNFKAWVWDDSDAHTPVPGVVEFEALELTDTQGQGRLQLALSVPIDEQGLVQTQLLPGEYRARVRPNAPDPIVFETKVRIWASDTPQTGGVILVPTGSKLNGRVRLPYADVSPKGTLIRAQGLIGMTGSPTFRPRSSSTIAGADGRFGFQGLDCGNCLATSSVNFALVAEPPAELGLPWGVKSRVAVAGETTVDFELAFPAVHFGELYYRKRNGTAGALPGALIRALALVDSEGKVLPLQTPACFELPDGGADGTPCARRTVEVARARSGNDGRFRLLLPTDLAEFGQ